MAAPGSSRIYSEVAAYALGGAARRIALVVLVPLLPLALSESEFGSWNLFIALVPLGAAVLDLGLSKAIGRFFYEIDAGDADSEARFFGAALSIRIWTAAPATGALAVLALAAWPWLAGQHLARWTVIPLLAAGLTEAIILAILAFARVLHDVSINVRVRAVQGLATVVGPVVGAVAAGLEGALVGLAVAQVPPTAIALRWAADRRTASTSDERSAISASALLQYGLPVTAHDVSWWLRNSSSIVVVGNVVAASLIGAYGVAFAGLSLLALAAWSLDVATAPYYYEWRSTGERWRDNTRGMYVATSSLMLMMSGTAVLLFGPLRNLLLAGQFAEADRLTPFILMAAAVQPCYFVAVKSFFYLKRTGLLAALTISMSTASILLTWILASQYGLRGAAISVFATYSAVALGTYFIAGLQENQPLPALLFLLPLVTASACALAFDSSPSTWFDLLTWSTLMLVAGFGLATSLKSLNSAGAFSSPSPDQLASR